MTQDRQSTAQESAARDAARLFQNLELPYLEAMRLELDRHITARRAEAYQQALVDVQRIAMSVGIPLEELMAGVKEVPPRKKEVKLYRNDQGETWGGYGRKPKWVTDWIEAGNDLEKLRVKE